MSTAKHIIKAIKIKMMLNRLSVAKENALRELMGLPPKMSWYDECTSTCMNFIKDKLCQVFCPCCVYDRNRHLKRPSCWTSPACREFTGFMGGIILSLLMYFVLIYQMDLPPAKACSICAVSGFILTLTLAFSRNLRCLVLLMLPQFFSGKGRMLLLLYALFLAMNHPLNNVRINIGVMAQSATCGQEMALNETKNMVKSAVAPMQSLMDKVKGVLQKLVDFANSMKKTYTVLKQTVGEIGATIKRVAIWLSQMTDRCNKKMGAPYYKCHDVFNSAYSKCKRKMKLLKFVCKPVKSIRALCNIVRVGELLCLIVKAIRDMIKKGVDLPVQRTLSSAKEMFYFNVTIIYQFNYTIEQSKQYSQIKDDISREIMSYIDKSLNFIRFFRDIMVITVIFILIKAILYRSKWLSKDRYDNIYITFTVRDLDERRKDNRKPGILPLNYDEEQKYIESFSGTMIPRELKKLAFGLVMYIISFFNAAFFLLCDVGLYSALHLIENNFGVVSSPPVPAHTKMHVAGSGPMADMYRSVIGLFDPLSDKTKSKVDVTPCVPHPSEPDWGVYKVIGIIYFACLILTITEAYGLRLRHLIMACYFPRRERKRAIWLFNHILKSRAGIMADARKNMKKKSMGDVDAQHISFKGRLATNFPICEKIMKWCGWQVKSCLYCGKEGKPDDYINFIHCDFFDCDAIYCLECYADLENVCPVCNNAVEMKTSDNSEEVDSSMDELQGMKRRVQKLVRKKKMEQLKAARTSSARLATIRAEFGGVGRDFDQNASALYSTSRYKKIRNRSNNNRNYYDQNYNTNALESSDDDLIQRRRYPDNLYSGNDSVPSGVSDDMPPHRHFSDSDSDKELSSGSSIDTDDLDFDYQNQEHSEYIYPEYIDSHENRNGRKVELVSDDFLSDTSSETYSESESESETFIFEPVSPRMSRE